MYRLARQLSPAFDRTEIHHFMAEISQSQLLVLSQTSIDFTMNSLVSKDLALISVLLDFMTGTGNGTATRRPRKLPPTAITAVTA